MIRYAVILILLSFIISGCAEIEPPSPEEILRHPLGKGPLSIGMVKEEVVSIWGEPDVINQEDGISRTGTVKEEWVYHARYSNIPLDAGYLSKTRHLNFDGNNLVRFE